LNVLLSKFCLLDMEHKMKWKYSWKYYEKLSDYLELNSCWLENHSWPDG